MYKSIIFTVVITVIGILLSDNVAVSTVIGIGAGSLFMMFSSNESKKEETGKNG